MRLDVVLEPGVQFRVPNHANFANPVANISVTASASKIFAAGDPRQIQFGSEDPFLIVAA